MRILRILLSTLLMAAFTLTPPTEPPAEEYGIALLNLHTFHTVTSFGFVDHHARVNVDFTGYGESTEIRIDVEIRKQGWFVSKPIVSETYYVRGKSYQDEFFYPIFRDGTYDCTVTYTVGEDLITFEDTRNYLLSEHTEHTHVWNTERTEPTYSKEGLERKFCYCGQNESTVLEKLSYPSHKEPEQQPSSSDGYSYVTTIPGSSAYSSAQCASGSYSQGFGLQSAQQCNCPFCKLDRALPDPQPTRPTTPSTPTVDPWKKQQEAYTNRNSNLNPCHINPRSPLH